MDTDIIHPTADPRLMPTTPTPGYYYEVHEQAWNRNWVFVGRSADPSKPVQCWAVGFGNRPLLKRVSKILEWCARHNMGPVANSLLCLAGYPGRRVFNTGTTVQWTSQAAGRATTKRGVIVRVVPAGTAPDVKGLPGIKQFDGILPRARESYIVGVPPRTPRGTPKLYHPQVSALRRADNEE